jgi:hypothetical protein
MTVKSCLPSQIARPHFTNKSTIMPSQNAMMQLHLKSIRQQIPVVLESWIRYKVIWNIFLYHGDQLEWRLENIDDGPNYCSPALPNFSLSVWFVQRMITDIAGDWYRTIGDKVQTYHYPHVPQRKPKENKHTLQWFLRLKGDIKAERQSEKNQYKEWMESKNEYRASVQAGDEEVNPPPAVPRAVRLGVFYFTAIAKVKKEMETDNSSHKHPLDEAVVEQPEKKQCVQIDEEDHTDCHPMDFDDVPDMVGV